MRDLGAGAAIGGGASGGGTPARPRRRRVRRLIGWLVFIYVAVCALTWGLQDFLVFPGERTQGRADAAPFEGDDSQIIHLKTADGTPVVGFYAPVARAGDRPGPAAIYFYGNAMSASGCFEESQHLRQLGLNVLVAEYAGYGLSGGKASERSLYATADAMYDYLLTRPDVDPHRIIAVGWSLGAAVATDLASRRPVAGLAAFSAFTSMPDMAQKRMPFLPARWLVSYRFDNRAKFAEMRCPIFLAHGVHDSLIPHAMTDALAAAAPAGKLTRLDVDSDHNDLFEAGGAQLWPALGSWLAANKIADTSAFVGR